MTAQLIQVNSRTLEDENATRCAKLQRLLAGDLDFHDERSFYASHNFHSFPAKFPPQLPRVFIEALTAPGDVVMDPMVGSGTTVVEALAAGRRAVGFDIDPLATILAKAKSTPVDPRVARVVGEKVLRQAQAQLQQNRDELEAMLEHRWDTRTKEFLDYWFLRHAQLELLALITQIERVEDLHLRLFLEVFFFHYYH